MSRQLLLIVIIPLTASGGVRGAEPSQPLKEPAYQTDEPLYCQLLVKGERATTIWIVMDGKACYFDRNANGDLTEPGEKLTRKPDPGNKVSFTDESLRKRFGEVAVRWRNEEPTFLDVSLSYEGKFVLGSIQDERSLSPTPEKSPVILVSDEFELFVLERPECYLWTGNNARSILSMTMGLGTKSSTGHFAYVDPESLTKQVCPIAEIQFAAGNRGEKPRLQFVDLDRRGMGYFLGSATIDPKTPPGNVTVTFKMKNWKLAEVEPVVAKTILPEFKNLPVISPK